MWKKYFNKLYCDIFINIWKYCVEYFWKYYEIFRKYWGIFFLPKNIYSYSQFCQKKQLINQKLIEPVIFGKNIFKKKSLLTRCHFGGTFFSKIFLPTKFEKPAFKNLDAFLTMQFAHCYFRKAKRESKNRDQRCQVKYFSPYFFVSI